MLKWRTPREAWFISTATLDLFQGMLGPSVRQTLATVGWWQGDDVIAHRTEQLSGGTAPPNRGTRRS